MGDEIICEFWGHDEWSAPRLFCWRGISKWELLGCDEVMLIFCGQLMCTGDVLDGGAEYIDFCPPREEEEEGGRLRPKKWHRTNCHQFMCMVHPRYLGKYLNTSLRRTLHFIIFWAKSLSKNHHSWHVLGHLHSPPDSHILAIPTTWLLLSQVLFLYHFDDAKVFAVKAFFLPLLPTLTHTLLLSHLPDLFHQTHLFIKYPLDYQPQYSPTDVTLMIWCLEAITFWSCVLIWLFSTSQSLPLCLGLSSSLIEQPPWWASSSHLCSV